MTRTASSSFSSFLSISATILLPILLAACLDSSSPCGDCPASHMWHPPAVKLGTSYTYALPTGDQATVTFKEIAQVKDGFGALREAVLVHETWTSKSDPHEVRFWLDLESRLIVQMDFGDRVEFGQPFYEWFRREQVFGHAPYLLALALEAKSGLPLDGAASLTIYGQEIRLEGREETGRLHLAIRFPHQEAPDIEVQQRETSLTIDRRTGAPVAFGDLLALGEGFSGATLITYTEGVDPIPWHAYVQPEGGQRHPLSQALMLGDERVFAENGPSLSGKEALRTARFAPGYQAFNASHSGVFVSAAFYEPVGATATWTFQFVAASPGPSYDIEAFRHDVEVQGRETAGLAVAAPTAEGELKEFFEPLFAPEYAGQFGRSTLHHAIQQAQAELGQDLSFSYVQQFDPERWPGAEEAILTVVAANMPGRALIFSGVNGQLLISR